jgi:hypothetical protein
MTTLIKHFNYQHLPPDLQEVSKPLHDLAHHFEDTLPESSEKTAGMRKLIEAKDCFVRAAVEKLQENKEIKHE